MALTEAPTLESLNPATGEPIGSVPITPPEDVQAVVDAVAKVQPFWAELTLRDRALYLERAAQVVIDEGDDIRDLIVREQGKPRNEAFAMEVLPTIDALHWIARAGQEILADEKIPMPQVFRARARRQGPDDRAPRRQPRPRHRRRAVGRVRQRRSDVQRNRAGVRVARDFRALHHRRSGGSAASAHRQPDGLGHRDRPDG